MGESFYEIYISNYHNGHFKYLIILSTINKFSINLGKKRKKCLSFRDVYWNTNEWNEMMSGFASQ